LDSRYFLRLSSAPHELESLIAATPTDIIVIDEIQRIPELLNEIHRLIEPQSHFFDYWLQCTQTVPGQGQSFGWPRLECRNVPADLQRNP
jgi:hypothetical protein